MPGKRMRQDFWRSTVPMSQILRLPLNMKYLPQKNFGRESAVLWRNIRILWKRRMEESKDMCMPEPSKEEPLMTGQLRPPYVDGDARRNGVGRALYEALEETLRLQGIRNAEACIAAPRRQDPYLNEDSIRFHEHSGYRMVGRFEKCAYKFGRWYDMVWMEKFIGDHPEVPVVLPPVLPFRELCARELSDCPAQNPDENRDHNGHADAEAPFTMQCQNP